MFSITFDTDWAPQFVIDHCLERLGDAELPATVFCTGRYRMPAGLDLEVGLHPNLMDDSTQGRGEADILSNLKRQMPEAIGVRTHRLYWHGLLPGLYAEHGVVYDSSLLVPLQQGLRPFRIRNVVRFPVWWADGVHFGRGFAMDGFDVPGLGESGLKVLLVHPIHIYLNSPNFVYAKDVISSLEPLEEARESDLSSRRYKGQGISTVFDAMLEFLSKRRNEVRKLQDWMDHAEPSML